MTLPLFVYGTLRSDGPNAGLLGKRTREPATVQGQLFALPHGYPAVRPGEGQVFGELVHDIDAAMLGVLDLYENVDDGLYRRVQVEARVGLQNVRCWVYLMDRPQDKGGRPVPSGRWKVRRRAGRS